MVGVPTSHRNNVVGAQSRNFEIKLIFSHNRESQSGKKLPQRNSHDTWDVNIVRISHKEVYKRGEGNQQLANVQTSFENQMSAEIQGSENGEQQMDIVVEPWKKLIIHELLEYKFEDLAKLVATQSVQQGGTAIPTISWAEGVAFLISPFPDESEVIIEEKLKGIIHYNTVLFALKPSFEARDLHARVANQDQFD